MKFICPTLGENDERDFLVTGSLEDFKIIVFSSPDEYERGMKYLELTDYQPTEVSIELFKELSKNDEEFNGVILNPHDENRVISKKELLNEF